LLTEIHFPVIIDIMDFDQKLSVSDLTELIRLTLEEGFSSVFVEGELSNCRPSSTGHLYFTLKDEKASISAVMFKNKLRYLSFEPKDGMLLRVRGNISVYPQRGTYQIICDEIEQAGTGDILLMLEKRKQKLAAEGLFDEEKKQAIPSFPDTIAVISSPTGAALKDILNVLERRAKGIHTIILPAPVQGIEAAPILARRIEQANEWNLADVIILGRGGGSLEDLLPFSDENVVRAIATSKIPIISAVGHEIDWALSDFVADLRAPTPSAAAELVSGNREDIREQIMQMKNDLYGDFQNRIRINRILLKPFSRENMEQQFRTILQPRLIRFDDAKEHLIAAFNEKTSALKHRLEIALTTLEAGSPQSIMERGFSVVRNQRTGKIIRSYKDVQEGDTMMIRPSEGMIHAIVEKVSAEKFSSEKTGEK
jgi:exodeoxyribonuclease VII large subunit